MKKIGSNFDLGDYEGRTPLHIAAKKGKLDVVKYLIGEGVDINMVDNGG